MNRTCPPWNRTRSSRYDVPRNWSWGGVVLSGLSRVSDHDSTNTSVYTLVVSAAGQMSEREAATTRICHKIKESSKYPSMLFQ